MKYIKITGIAILMSAALFLLKVPYLDNINTDLATSLTSAYINAHGTAEFKDDYLLGHGTVTMGVFHNFLFRDWNNDTVEDMFAAVTMRRLAVFSFFVFFIGCFLIVAGFENYISLGIMLIFFMMTPVKGYFESWGIYFNLYGAMSNYFNCFVPLFIFSLIRYPGSVFLPGVMIIIFASIHPTSAMAFSVSAAIFYSLRKNWKQVFLVSLVTVAGMLSAIFVNAGNMTGAITVTKEVIDFITLRRGGRLFFFSWDNSTPMPSAIRTYIYIFWKFITVYWPILIAVPVIFFRNRFAVVKNYVDRNIAVLFYAAALLPTAAIAATFLMRAVLFMHIRPFLFGIETMRIERLAWPFFMVGSFLSAVNFYKGHRIRYGRAALGIISVLFIAMHFTYSRLEWSVCRALGNDTPLSNSFISKSVKEDYETLKALASLGRSDLYVPDNDFLNEFLRMATKKPIYFSFEDGGYASQFGEVAMREWTKRYRLLKSVDFSSPAAISDLFKHEPNLGGLVMVYDEKYETLPLSKTRIGRYLLVER